MVIDFYDTSALLALNEPLGPGINYISHFVLAELEQIKTSFNKDREIKERARKIARYLISQTENFRCDTFPIKEIEKHKKKLGFLPDNMDGNILAEASLINKKNRIVFWTADVNMLLFAKKLNFYAINFVDGKEEEKKPWDGWRDFHPTEEQMNMLYSDPKFNVLGAETNEYCKIWEGKEIKDVLRWDGGEYRKLKYSNFRNSFLEKNIKPLNLEQKMAFDLLQNQNITVKVITGVPGGGKDYIQILHALDMVNRGLFDKIIYVRNLIPFKDAPEIGFLAGDLEAKISWGLGPIRSILGEEGLVMMEEQGIIQNTNLAFIRGMSFARSIVYISEGQNISASGYKLLVSRCGEGSQLWINADYKQTDLDKFKRDNGIVRLTNSLKGNPLFGTVKLTETERSQTAELAGII